MAPPNNSGKRKENFMKWKEPARAESSQGNPPRSMSVAPNSKRKGASSWASKAAPPTEFRNSKNLEPSSENAGRSVDRSLPLRERGALLERSSQAMNRGGSSASTHHRVISSSTANEMLLRGTRAGVQRGRQGGISEGDLEGPASTEPILDGVNVASTEGGDYTSRRAHRGEGGVVRECRGAHAGSHASTQSAQRSVHDQRRMPSIPNSVLVGRGLSPAGVRSSQVNLRRPLVGRSTSRTVLNAGRGSSGRRSATLSLEVDGFGNTAQGCRGAVNPPLVERDSASSIRKDTDDEQEERSMNSAEHEGHTNAMAFGEEQRERIAISFYSDNRQTDFSDECEEEEEEGRLVEDVVQDYGISGAEEEDVAYPTETDKRRERRHEHSGRIREGDRHHAKGLPRNYLLVDDFTHEPYGPGVGAWKKELMLLTRSLDPAIANINRQPTDAVSEVAEWIQHTWEYSSPVKWEIVKEVIAREVTLRRSQLFKRIRMKAKKPDGMFDRTWRSLERQVQSPAMIRKIENCSKANACRNNFGRTGPSGEVGVQERLRKKLKRSPSPEEVRAEMARPKGYGGRSKRNLEVDDVMHGGGFAIVPSKNQRSSRPWGDGRGEGVENRDSRTEALGGGSRGAASSRVLSLSREEVAQHPAFICIMERLEALEKRGNNKEHESEVADNNGILPTSTEETPQQLPMEKEAGRTIKKVGMDSSEAASSVPSCGGTSEEEH